MLAQGRSTPQLREWLDRLAPVVRTARATLAEVPPGKLALRTGCRRSDQGHLLVPFFERTYRVSLDDFRVRRAETEEQPSSFTKSLILSYLSTADGATPSRRWIGFRELPHGTFYTQAFQGYTGNRLVRELEGGLTALRQAAERLGGEPLEISDAGYAFTVFPHLHLAVVYWRGDEEFPSQARVLFEDTAPHYLSTDGLAILGSQLVGRLLKAAR